MTSEFTPEANQATTRRNSRASSIGLTPTALSGLNHLDTFRRAVPHHDGWRRPTTRRPVDSPQLLAPHRVTVALVPDRAQKALGIEVLRLLADIELLVHAVGVVVLEVADQLVPARGKLQRHPADRGGIDALT